MRIIPHRPLIRTEKKSRPTVARVNLRSIPTATRLALIARAAGRCEFPDCNQFLFEHRVTSRSGNFAQLGHIYAFSPTGPRASPARRDRHDDPSNLMLLCPDCHHLIDQQPGDYDVPALKRFKRVHEARIRRVTDQGPQLATVPLVLTANIAGEPVDIHPAHIRHAIAPRNPASEELLIDLTHVSDLVPAAFYQAATATIDDKLRTFYDATTTQSRPRHLSVFAIAPIPILVYLGSKLSDKIPTDLYQRHRDTEDWTWKTSGILNTFTFRPTTKGTNAKNAALLLSLSGTITPQQLPKAMDSSFTLYEISVEGLQPRPGLLRRREELERFTTTYRHALSTIAASHPGLTELHVLPAVPPPVAIAIGRTRLPKVDPELVIYDYDKRKNGFTPHGRINT